ncbi:MAG: formylmethanofuran--tetrahydromethanopterin N-formyltransferase [Planctomycetaceae bacterium]|nr:formylmethanofuran--tetrahydromethanopterin N-formyltransferase [Planctomycetaceae bacterium]
MACIVDDTYAEAFRSISAEVLVTARDRYWLDQAAAAATGHASSTIFCDCEAGIDRFVGPGGDESFETPDGRPGVILQFHVPRFVKNREKHLEKTLLYRLSQNILTCPTTRCFNVLETDGNFKLGRKIALFGDGHQFRDERYGRKVWVIPIMGGEFVLDRRFGFRDSLMGGNLWFMGESEDAAIDATQQALAAIQEIPGVITPFPGGIAASGSKAGSRYSFLIASTNHPFCPTLREKLGDECQLPDGVTSVMEIIINGHDLETVTRATHAGIAAAVDMPGLVRISAGNYGGRLGKNFVYLRPETAAAQQKEPTG